MHVEYRVTLPDHDWVLAEKHKLIPSVYALNEIEINKIGNPKAVGYSGPTYIAIRSGKHSSSTAATHCIDLQHVLQSPDFIHFTTFEGKTKPILLITADGGPDENPR